MARTIYPYSIWEAYITDDSGNIVTGATVTVTDENTGEIVGLRAGPKTGGPQDNPFTTGSDGLARFYFRQQAPQWLKVSVEKGLFSTEFRYQRLGNASVYTVSDGGSQSGDEYLLTREVIKQEFVQSAATNNLDASTDPTVNDDSDDGYSVNSAWINTTSSPNEAFRCLDSTVGAAVWVNTTLTIGELGTVALLNAGTGSLEVRNNTENEAFFSAALVNNLVAAADPAVTNDTNEGYSVLSIWINQAASPPEIWQCSDNTAGAAVWSLTNATTASFGTIVEYDQGTGAGEIRINSENEAQFAPISSSFEINEQTGTSYTVVASDLGKVIRFTNAAAITLTINSGFTNGFNFLVEQSGAGVITWAGTATLNALNSQTKSSGQYALISFVATNTDEFTVSGDYA